MKTILFPTDFSPNADHALEYALQFIGRLPAKLILMNTWMLPPSDDGMVVPMIDVLKKDSEKALEGLKQKILSKEGMQDLSCELMSMMGDPVIAIEEILQDRQVDYIVMGTKGATGLDRLIMGSTSDGVIHKALCPVIVVPEKVRIKPINKIVFAADYDKIEDKSIIDPLLDIAKAFKAEILIFNIVNKAKELSMEHAVEAVQLEHEFEGVKHDYFFSDNDDNIVEGINSFIEEKEADLLVMVTKHNNYFDRVFRLSDTTKMTLHLHTPLLVLHNK